MRKKIVVERVTCDLCGQDIRYSMGVWKEVVINNCVCEMCSTCGGAFEKVSNYMRDELNITVIIKPLEWEDNDD